MDGPDVADDTVAFDGIGLGRRLSLYRLPEIDWSSIGVNRPRHHVRRRG
jgi:hypothetical protein